MVLNYLVNLNKIDVQMWRTHWWRWKFVGLVIRGDNNWVTMNEHSAFTFWKFFWKTIMWCNISNVYMAYRLARLWASSCCSCKFSKHMEKLRLTFTMFFKNSNDIYTKTTKKKKKGQVQCSNKYKLFQSF